MEPNTTYSLNFGRAIKDVNEGNSQKNYTYVFSTGAAIDENTFSGKVILAETGKVDTALLVVLHKNLDDSAVAKERPRYYTKLDGKGNFQFHYLPKGTFAVYALPNDYAKRYDDSTKLFSFLNAPVQIKDTATLPVTLYAYQQAKEKEKQETSASTSPIKTPNKKNPKEDNRLKLSTNISGGQQDLLGNLELTFNHKLRNFDTLKIKLTDTNYHSFKDVRFIWDTSLTKISLIYKWIENTEYKLVIEKDAVADSAGTTLLKNDTVHFTTKKESDYGSIRLRFNNVDLSKNPVLQLVQNDKIVELITLTQKEWYRKMYIPGEYEMRILYDDNKNGIWDAGNFFGIKRQPEIVQSVPRQLNIKANWDNEVEINL